MQGDLARRRPGRELQGRDEAQGLLDGGGDQRRVGLQQRPLVGVLGEQLEQAAGQPGGGLHPAEEEDHHQAADLRGRRDLRVHERHPVDVGLHERRDQVLARRAAAVLEQIDEVLLDAGGGCPRHRGQVGCAGYPVLQLVGPVLQLLAPRPLHGVLVVPARHAHQVEEHVEGHGPGQLLRDIDGGRPPAPRSATRRRGRAPPRGSRPRAGLCGAAGSTAAPPGGPGRAGGCPCCRGTPAGPAPDGCRRCPCPRSCGTCPRRAPPPARPRSGSGRTSPGSRCSRPGASSRIHRYTANGSDG